MKTYHLTDHTLPEIVADRLAATGVSVRALAHDPSIVGSMSPSTVFRFVSGRFDTKSENVAQILNAVGLALVVVDDLPPKRRGRGGH